MKQTAPKSQTLGSDFHQSFATKKLKNGCNQNVNLQFLTSLITFRDPKLHNHTRRPHHIAMWSSTVLYPSLWFLVYLQLKNNSKQLQTRDLPKIHSWSAVSWTQRFSRGKPFSMFVPKSKKQLHDFALVLPAGQSEYYCLTWYPVCFMVMTIILIIYYLFGLKILLLWVWFPFTHHLIRC